MKTSSQHITFERLVDLAEGRLDQSVQRAARTHLTECSSCAKQLTRIGEAISLMRTDTAEDAPSGTIAHALNLFDSRASQPGPSLVRRVLAALSFDSHQLTPAYGVRSAGAGAARQLLYTIEENDLDLRLTPSGEDWVVSGQMLGDCTGGHVILQGANAAVEAALNEQCEFALPPVPRGSYTLRLRLDEIETEIPELILNS